MFVYNNNNIRIFAERQKEMLRLSSPSERWRARGKYWKTFSPLRKHIYLSIPTFSIKLSYVCEWNSWNYSARLVNVSAFSSHTHYIIYYTSIIIILLFSGEIRLWFWRKSFHILYTRFNVLCIICHFSYRVGYLIKWINFKQTCCMSNSSSTVMCE